MIGNDTERVSVIGYLLKQLHYLGHSGNASGIDIEWGKHLPVLHFLPWNRFNFEVSRPKYSLSIEEAPANLVHKAEGIMEDHHPYGVSLQGAPRKFHTRNVFQALGQELTPSTYTDLCVYCAPESGSGKVSGGTSTAVEICRSHGIPTFNLRKDSDFYELKALLLKEIKTPIDLSKIS